MVQGYSLSTWDAESGGLWVWGCPVQHSKIPSSCLVGGWGAHLEHSLLYIRLTGYVQVFLSGRTCLCSLAVLPLWFFFSATSPWLKEACLMTMSSSCLLDTTSQLWSSQQRWWKKWRSIRLLWNASLRVEGSAVFYLKETIGAITSSFR